jgi:hypothetical protein
LFPGLTGFSLLSDSLRSVVTDLPVNLIFYVTGGNKKATFTVMQDLPGADSIGLQDL